MNWHTHVETVKPHLVRIETPDTLGTGFLIHRAEGTFGVATAAHVVRNARAWEQCITIHHGAFAAACVLAPPNRVVALHPELDSAYVSGELPELKNDSFPEEPIEHIPFRAAVHPGVEIGWLGYPSMIHDTPCFFSGHVSAYVEGRYFIDGVAIQGVSGGPAFHYGRGTGRPETRVRILGSVSAYRPGGDALPGLLVADNCTQWPEVIRST